MSSSATDPEAILKYEVEVGDKGRVELNLPFAAGDRVVVYICHENDEDFADLKAAAESSLGFWDNPLDDEDWNQRSFPAALRMTP